MQRLCNHCQFELPEGASRCPRCLLEAGFEAVFGPAGEDSPTRTDAPSAAGSSTSPSAEEGSPLGGQRFGDYELIEEIARGGMGVVYKARQIRLNRTVALKLILSGQFASKQEVLRFRAEAEAAANLHHPNIVAIYETGEQAGQQYFSMEYVAGRNLADIVRDGPLPSARAARYVEIISRAIHYAPGPKCPPPHLGGDERPTRSK